jgi:hypothetical protein
MVAEHSDENRSAAQSDKVQHKQQERAGKRPPRRGDGVLHNG